MDFSYGLPLFFFIIALFYSMVGFGGGSSYISVLVLSQYSYQQIPSLALLCNIIVTLGGCWHFYRAGYFKIKNILPFVTTSIPMAYLGGIVNIQRDIFCLILGLSLLMIAFLMIIPSKKFTPKTNITWKNAWFIGLPIGGILGFLSGLVGIGGGIFLSPALILLKWTHIKEASTAACFFIVINSIAGLSGHIQKGIPDISTFIPLGIAVLLGGQIGSQLGAYRISKSILRPILGCIIFLASYKLLFQFFYQK